MSNGKIYIKNNNQVDRLKLKDTEIYSMCANLTGTSIDVSTSTFFKKTITANTTFSFTGVESGKSAVFTLVLENAGAYTVAFPSSVVWVNGIPEFETDGIDILNFVTTDGGTTWYNTDKKIELISNNDIDTLVNDNTEIEQIDLPALAQYAFVLGSTPSTTEGAMWVDFGTATDTFVLPLTQISTADGAMWME